MNAAFEKAKNVVVIVPGSETLIIGIGSSSEPQFYPNSILYRSNIDPQPSSQSGAKEQDDKSEKQETRDEIIRELKLPGNDYYYSAHIREVPCQEMDVDDDRKVLLGDDVESHFSAHDFKRVRPLGKEGLDKSRSETQIRNDLYSIWSTAIVQKLEIQESDFVNYGVVLAVPEHLSVAEMELLMDVVLIDLKFKEAIIHADCAAALFGQGVSSGCLVNLEADSVRVICVEDGVVIPSSAQFLPYGGDDIAQALAWMLDEFGKIRKEPKWNTLSEMEMKRVRDTACFLPTEGSEEALESHIKASLPIRLYRNSEDGKHYIQEARIGAAACIAPMGLFYPTLFSSLPIITLSHTMSSSEAFYSSILDQTPNNTKQKSSTKTLVANYEQLPLDLAIVKSISSAEKVDQRRRLYTSILIVGSSSHVQGLSDMLERRVLSALPADEVIDTVAVLETKWPAQHLIWKGGCVIAILTPAEQWIDQKEWKEGVRLDKPGKYGKTDRLRSKAFWMLKTELGLD